MLSGDVDIDIGELGDVAIDIGELGVVENVGVAVGIASIALPVPELQTTSGFVSTMLI